LVDLTLVFFPLCSGGLFSLQHVSGSLSETDDGEAEKHVTGWVVLDAQWVAGQLQWLRDRLLLRLLVSVCMGLPVMIFASSQVESTRHLISVVLLEPFTACLA